MTISRTIRLTINAVVVGLFGAVALSDGDLISVRVWLVVVAIGITGLVLVELIEVVEFEPVRLSPLLRVLRASSRRRRGGRGERSVEVLVVTAQRDARLYSSRLRPRLKAIVDHFAPLGPGLDARRQPEDGRELLGDDAWLVDPDITDRAPTIAELERLLDAVGVDAVTPDPARRRRGP